MCVIKRVCVRLRVCLCVRVCSCDTNGEAKTCAKRTHVFPQYRAKGQEDSNIKQYLKPFFFFQNKSTLKCDFKIFKINTSVGFFFFFNSVIYLKSCGLIFFHVNFEFSK